MGLVQELLYLCNCQSGCKVLSILHNVKVLFSLVSHLVGEMSDFAVELEEHALHFIKLIVELLLVIL